MTKRILITTESLRMGGVETALLSLLKVLKSYDTEIDLYVLEEGVLKEEYDKLTKVNIIPIKIPKNKAIYRIMKNLKCKSLIKKYKKINHKKYDLAIAFYGINNYSDMYVAASIAKEKFIWIHSNFETLYHLSKYKKIIKIRNKIIQKKFKYFNNIISVSNSAKKGFINTFQGHENKIKVINNFMDTSRLEQRYEKCDYKMLGENKLIYVGRLADIKRVDILIEEFRKVLQELPDSYLYIIGDGPEENRLKGIVKNYKLQDKIIFLGNQNNPFKYINAADIVVTASSHEAYSINSLEALAMNKYFVSANNEGAEDIFYLTNKADINNGIICKPEYMHKHIVYYLQNKGKIKPNFDIKKANNKIEEQIVKIFEIAK